MKALLFILVGFSLFVGGAAMFMVGNSDGNFPWLASYALVPIPFGVIFVYMGMRGVLADLDKAQKP